MASRKNGCWNLRTKRTTIPTEIEPFGGAATCLGGAIRDILASRAYTHQAMRVTGCADPNTPLDGYRTGAACSSGSITTGAAHGFSAYGNQIGLATGQVDGDLSSRRMWQSGWRLARWSAR